MIILIRSEQKKLGFTIVELLVVIVVIAILAAITVIAYNGIQARANDSRMQTGVSQLEKAIRLWNVNTGEYPKGGYGSTAAVGATNCADGSGGWIYSGVYACTLEDVLQKQSLIPSNFTLNLPPNKGYGGGYDGRNSIMFYACNDPGEFALYYYLQNPSTSDTASLTNVESNGCTTSPRVTYAMKAARYIQL
jgi:prepilin-type N-terminal cleavage/methylation domain-containing protein